MPHDSKVFVTGGAGFVGSHLVDRLLTQGDRVVVFDNLSTGLPEFLEGARRHEGFTFVEGDLLDQGALRDAMTGCRRVYHLAANADVRFGLDHPRKDLEQNTVATFNVLEAMRAEGVGEIAFASTASVYGEPDIFPTPENAPFPVQTSLYAASKLAGEGLISAYCKGFGFRGWIFRMVSVLGPRYTHGHVYDFYKKLSANPDDLQVLGNGKQRKSYLHVHDCVDAVLLAVTKARNEINILNLGTEEYTDVNESVTWITGALGVAPRISYSGGVRGWVGDSPFIYVDIGTIRALGWEPKHTIREGVLTTLEWLQANRWVLDRRA